ncbi:ISKra4 family transposase [Desulfococcaceae bacterium HSG9]|nr:ISKra4 family transposase [Desulfococcaceae bacterium HSG9]
MFGRVESKRTGYGNRGESSIFPHDERLETPGRLYSYPLQEKVCRVAVRSSYDEIDETLGKYTRAHVPKRQSIGIVSKSSEDFETFYELKTPFPSSGGDILVLTADGKGVVMREDALRDKTRLRGRTQKKSERLSKGEKKNRKREALAASVYDIKPRNRSIDDVMGEVCREMDSAGRREKPEGKRVWASVEKEKKFVFDEMPEEGLKRNPGDKTVVFVCDGAESIQNPAVDILKPGFKNNSLKFIIILDMIHVIEYLWKAVYALGKTGREAERQVDKHLRMILEGGCHVAAAAIRCSATRKKLKGKKRETLDRTANYILENKEYMRYDEYLAAGLPIASGVIEGACEHPVKDRFEISGARWGLQGAEALLKLRAVYQSGDWEEYRKFISDGSESGYIMMVAGDLSIMKKASLNFQ